ncbi:TPA: DUF1673 domain-containing protein [Methanosarcina acetivorans]|uniref:DUF1673 domain-containing protein n=2 Tax=Methanosarcina acetivorans TaxID=2214 RepID=Q8THM8_METAC|nr:DUF1673 domain-containing protein [Methanosarcina acetivorans]AAM07826.1 predicted protein [Methanosarcina acetivorans C2A]HIH94199.1 DUF1673 domain-containing protein [Methanosarcina acetivorans]
MDVFIKSIRKLMGWCPNAKALETRHSICPEYLEADNQSRGKDAGNNPILPSGWWNKRHNRSLIASSVFTIFSLYWITFQGESLKNEAFILGLIIGIILNPLLCIWNWRFLDKIKNSNKKVRTKNKLMTIAGILGLTTLLIESSSRGGEFVLTFSLTCASGFCLTAFLYYLTDTYWEKKNKKIVLLEGYYAPEIYVINKDAER